MYILYIHTYTYIYIGLHIAYVQYHGDAILACIGLTWFMGRKLGVPIKKSN